MARTKTSSIIKTRSQSRTGARTGMNDRTIDSAAPAPVATGRTIGGGTNDRTITVAPTPVVTTDPVDDLFAGRPTTGALKDPPPAAVPITGMKPTPRDSDDDAKKSAAKPKPKGRPKKVAPKARKPRKPRTDPTDDLVDPMANIHVGDAIPGVVTAGRLARAGGNDPVLTDPVLANLEQLAPEQPEPQPKKTRRTPRASRAHRAGHGDDDDD